MSKRIHDNDNDERIVVRDGIMRTEGLEVSKSHDFAFCQKLVRKLQAVHQRYFGSVIKPVGERGKQAC